MREALEARRRTWRQKVRIKDISGHHTFYVDFGEYQDGRLGEVFVTAKRYGTAVRGMLDSFARMASVALQSGTPAHEVARKLCEQEYPPYGPIEADGSSVTYCQSIADYIGQEILASYGEDGKRRPPAEGTAA